MEIQKRLGEYEPTPETTDRPFQVDKYGHHRIMVRGKSSEWYKHYQFATLKVDDQIYIGVPRIHSGDLPKECVLRVEKVDEDGESNFYQFKIIDIEQSPATRVLERHEIFDIIYDPVYGDDYNVVVKESKCKDFVKIRIIEIAPFGSKEPDKILDEEAVKDFIIDAFDPYQVDIYNTEEELINK